MTWIKAIVSEIAGLFVDDGRFAFAIVAFLALCAVALPIMPVSPAGKCALLFVGLGVILVASATMAGRRTK